MTADYWVDFDFNFINIKSILTKSHQFHFQHINIFICSGSIFTEPSYHYLYIYIRCPKTRNGGFHIPTQQITAVFVICQYIGIHWMVNVFFQYHQCMQINDVIDNTILYLILLAIFANIFANVSMCYGHLNQVSPIHFQWCCQ